VDYSKIKHRKINYRANKRDEMSIDTEKIAQVSTAMIIVEQANKIKTLEAKNGELESWKNKAKEKMPAMQMRIHELEAKNGELEKKLEIAVNCTKNIRERLRSKSVSMRSFKIIDDEISKMKEAINGEGV
jgi:hypothetical protein